MEGTTVSVWQALFGKTLTPKEKISMLRQEMEREIIHADMGVVRLQNQASATNRDLDKLIERGRDERLQMIQARQLAIHENAIAEAYQARAHMQQILLQIQSGEDTARLGDMISKGERAVRTVNMALNQPKRMYEMQQFSETMFESRLAREEITEGVGEGLTTGVQEAGDKLIRMKLEERKIKILDGMKAQNEATQQDDGDDEVGRRLKSIRAGK